MTAAIRQTPTPANGGSDDGQIYPVKVSTEIEALWRVSFGWLTSIGGTGNSFTASSDTAVVTAIAGLQRPMGFWYRPVIANNGAVDGTIDGFNASVRDAYGNALQGGEFAVGGCYPLIFDGSVLVAPTVTAGAAATIQTAPDAIFVDKKASGVDGGTFTSGAWRARALNTAIRNVAAANITFDPVAGTFTPSAGSWYIEWSAPAYQAQSHQTRLFNITDGTNPPDDYYGSTERIGSGSVSATRSMGEATLTLTTAKEFRIEHRCSSTTNNTGFGISSGFGGPEIYTRVRIWKQ